MIKYWTAKFLFWYDILLHTIGSGLGRFIGYSFGAIFGVIFASFSMAFKEGFSSSAKAHREVFEYLYYKEKSKNIKKNKDNKKE